MYKAKYSKQVKKFLVKCDKHIFAQFEKRLELLLQNPKHEQLDIKKLKNQPCYRLRIGKYRFLYEITQEELLIYFVKADSRGDIYS